MSGVRWLVVRALLYVYMYIDIVVMVCARGVGVLFRSCCFPLFRLRLLFLVRCSRVVLFVAVAIWCNRVTMRCNRFFVSGGYSFTLRVLVRFWRILQAFTVCL